jgi:predicted kinase
MADQPRSVKISDDERRGWSSDRPRRDGAPPRPPDVSVRCRVLKPADQLRYSPGSLLVIVSGSAAERDRFAERLIDNRTVLSLDKVRAVLAGRAGQEEIETRAPELLDGALRKRFESGQTAVVLAETLGAEERERYVRMAAAARRPRHLILVEAPASVVDPDDQATLNDLRRRLDSGELGTEGFQTALRIGGQALGELKRILFRPPPRDD